MDARKELVAVKNLTASADLPYGLGPVVAFASPPLAGLALALLGLTNLVWLDPLLQWQPLPPGSPLRAPFAVVSGGLLLAGGVLILARRERLGARIAAAWILLWTIALELPAAFGGGRPLVVGALGIAETLAMALGIVTLAGHVTERRWWTLAFGLCLVVFGVSHFTYPDFTAQMVPTWLPARLVLAYLTGAIHAAAGLAIVARIKVALVAAIEASMMTSFVLLLHVPRAAAAPGDRTEITMLVIALTLTAATWLVAARARQSGAQLEH